MTKLIVVTLALFAGVGGAHAQGATPKDARSGEAGFRAGCSTQIQVNPCSRVCWELWTETQKREIEARCAARAGKKSGVAR